LEFGGFVLLNFCNTAIRKYSAEIPSSKVGFTNTITAAERTIRHLVCGA
jgi:hypothetical protein